MSARRGSITDARPALRQRQRRLRRRRLLPVLVLLLVLGLAGAGTWLVGWSSVLALTRVEVTGTSVLTAEQVVAAADAPVGRPLARVDTDAVAARVAGLAPVREVEVSRGWPSTLRVEVTERTPVLATGSGRQLTLVDAEGVGYTTVAELPEGVVRATLAEEVPAEDRHELLVDLATVVRALPAPLLEQVERVGTASADTIELHLAEDRVVEWGSADDSALKAEVAVVLLEQEGEVYNVTVPSHPTVR